MDWPCATRACTRIASVPLQALVVGEWGHFSITAVYARRRGWNLVDHSAVPIVVQDRQYAGEFAGKLEIVIDLLRLFARDDHRIGAERSEEHTSALQSPCN